MLVNLVLVLVPQAIGSKFLTAVVAAEHLEIVAGVFKQEVFLEAVVILKRLSTGLATFEQTEESSALLSKREFHFGGNYSRLERTNLWSVLPEVFLQRTFKSESFAALIARIFLAVGLFQVAMETLSGSERLFALVAVETLPVEIFCSLHSGLGRRLSCTNCFVIVPLTFCRQNFAADSTSERVVIVVGVIFSKVRLQFCAAIKQQFST
jgi:hypothetical protein